MSDQITSEQGSQQSQGTSGMAIAGLVLGVVALIMSFIPIINNAAFIAAIVGVILAIAGRSQAKKGTKGGAGVAMAGIVLNIIAIVITLLMQMACSAALDSMTSGSSGTVSGGSASAASSESASAQTDTANMAAGQTVDLDNGLSVTLNSVTPGLANYDGSPVTAVSVTYTNNGSSNASFNVLDWKAEDANGAQRSMTYYTQGTEELSSGTLSKGGTVTGNIYFDEPIVKVYYYSSFLNSDSNIAWNVA